MMVWVSVGLVISGSGDSGARNAPPSYGDKPRHRGADPGAFTLLGVFPLPESSHRVDRLSGAGKTTGNPEEEGHAGRPRPGGSAGVSPSAARARHLGAIDTGY